MGSLGVEQLTTGHLVDLPAIEEGEDGLEEIVRKHEDTVQADGKLVKSHDGHLADVTWRIRGDGMTNHLLNNTGPTSTAAATAVHKILNATCIKSYVIDW